MQDNNTTMSTIEVPCARIQTDELLIGLDESEALFNWMQTRAESQRLRWALLFMWEGVRWGYFDAQAGYRLMLPSNELAASHRINPATCTVRTLQQAYLFGEQSEVYLWKDQDQRLLVRSIVDKDTPEHEANLSYCFDDQVLIVGGHYAAAGEGFTLLKQGSAPGMYRHLIPGKPGLASDGTLDELIYLTRRHYADAHGDIIVSRYRTLEQNGQVLIHG